MPRNTFTTHCFELPGEYVQFLSPYLADTPLCGVRILWTDFGCLQAWCLIVCKRHNVAKNPSLEEQQQLLQKTRKKENGGKKRRSKYVASLYVESGVSSVDDSFLSCTRA